MIAGQIPPAFIPSRGNAVTNCQEMAGAPLITMYATIATIGAMVSKASRVRAPKPRRWMVWRDWSGKVFHRRYIKVTER